MPACSCLQRGLAIVRKHDFTGRADACRLTWTGGVLGPLSAGYAGSAEFHVPNKNGLSPEDCLHWDWG